MKNEIISIEFNDRYAVFVRDCTINNKEITKNLGKVVKIIAYGINGSLLVKFLDGTTGWTTYGEVRSIKNDVLPDELIERFMN
jgi:hypothetical protein